ncbi:MAG: hypothetical protein MJY44_02380 [Bacteroidales bacterium]|nr:hypothetical protein [Bacteroidales bacterium]
MMKKTFNFFVTALAAVAAIATVQSCSLKEEPASPKAVSDVRAFFPTKIVSGQRMTITASGLSEAIEVIFPGEITVTDFEIVNDGMIRVTAPEGIVPNSVRSKATTGGVASGDLSVRTRTGVITFPIQMTIGYTEVLSYSKEPGDVVKGGERLTIYGTDLEFISGVELINSDDEPMLVPAADFYRQGTDAVVITIPENVAPYSFCGTIHTIDGRDIEMAEFQYAAGGDGHWETSEHVIWENDDPSGNGPVNWNGVYRFGLDGNDGNHECIATFSQEDWEIIKEGSFFVSVQGFANANLRVTTGWWSAAYGGGEHNSIEEAVKYEAGIYVIPINIKEDGNIYDLIDSQHLCLSGSDCTPLKIYTEEQIWVTY